jgi:hypothetical protein
VRLGPNLPPTYPDREELSPGPCVARRFQEQQQRLQQVKAMTPRQAPDHPITGAAFRVVHNPVFEKVVLLVIAVNAVFLCIQYPNAPAFFTDMLTLGNVFFSTFFACEALLKILALGKKYFHRGVNLFDLVVTVVGIVDILLSLRSGCGGSSSVMLKVLRSLRVFRLIRLVRWVLLRSGPAPDDHPDH